MTVIIFIILFLLNAILFSIAHNDLRKTTIKAQLALICAGATIGAFGGYLIGLLMVIIR